MQNQYTGHSTGTVHYYTDRLSGECHAPDRIGLESTPAVLAVHGMHPYG